MEKSKETQARLIQAGIRLFSKHGYEAVSTRTIGQEANANISAISLYFGSKEGFYKATLEHVAEKIGEEFFPFTSKVKKAREDGPIGTEAAYKLIEEYIDLLIDTVINPAHPEYLQLQYVEQMTPAGEDYPITAALCRDTEFVVSQLLSDYWQTDNHFACKLICRLIVGALVSIGEHPLYIRAAIGVVNDMPIPQEACKYLRSYLLNSINSFQI